MVMFQSRTSKGSPTRDELEQRHVLLTKGVDEEAFIGSSHHVNLEKEGERESIGERDLICPVLTSNPLSRTVDEMYYWTSYQVALKGDHSSVTR